MKTFLLVSEDVEGKYDIPVVVRTTQDKINNYLFVLIAEDGLKEAETPNLLYVTTKYT